MIEEIPNFASPDFCQELIKSGKFAMTSNIYDKQYYLLDFITKESSIPVFNKLIDLFDKKTNSIIPFFPYRWIMLMKYPKNTGVIYRHKDTYGPTEEYERKSYSMLLYLNDIEDGGETVIFDGDKELIIKPESGKLLIMSGDIDHEARRPISDDKYVVLSRHN